MHEFRPADVIDQDTLLAESLIDGDIEALDTLVARYGRAVEAVVGASSHQGASDRAAGVFAQAWLERGNLDPGSDFAPWLSGLAAAIADRPTGDPDTAWIIAMAIEAIEPEQRASLRSHHVDGEELADGADRHELRLRRRLSHLGNEAEIVAALEGAPQWTDPATDLPASVRSRLGIADSVPDPDLDDRGDAGQADHEEPERPSRVARSLRPVLLGLAGAVVVLFVAIVGLSAASGSPDPIAFTAELIPTGVILDVDGGELSVTERDNGLRLDLDAPSLPRRAGDQFYEAVLVLADGTELAVGTFNEGFDVTLAGGVSLDRVDEFLVVTRELGSDATDVILKLDIPRR